MGFTRYRLGTFYKEVDVEIDINEVLDQIPDKDLLSYLETRKLGVNKDDPGFSGLVSEAYDALTIGEEGICKLKLEQALFPKFKSIADCMKRFAALKASA